MTPYLGRLVGKKDLGTDIKLLQVELVEPNGKARFADYRPGQFAFVSALGIGEAPFGIASTPSGNGLLEFGIAKVGSVTAALHSLEVGEIVGVRGPLGNGFPMDEMKDKNICVLGGGIGGAPLRPVIRDILDQRSDYGHLTILWAARNPSLLVFTDEYDLWRSAPNTELHVTVDEGDEEWKAAGGNEGLITQLLETIAPSPENAVTITCGPPAMLHFVTLTLHELGFSLDQMWTTLEARMHCGICKCGRCNMGDKFVCTDGPVFRQDEVAGFLETYL
ncbi:MAG: FAD/NAD(P)-binding protein [Anaerolineaceae bacterium]|nr:MAG: FAD/NAD(P)-binding protein [Anaerolineaceae bacterium]